MRGFDLMSKLPNFLLMKLPAIPFSWISFEHKIHKSMICTFKCGRLFIVVTYQFRCITYWRGACSFELLFIEDLTYKTWLYTMFLISVLSKYGDIETWVMLRLSTRISIALKISTFLSDYKLFTSNNYSDKF